MIHKFWLSRKERERLNDEESIRKGRELVKYVLSDLWSPLSYSQREIVEYWGVLENLKDRDAKNIWEYRPK